MSNIRTTLEVICNSANEYLQNTNRRDDDWVLLSNLTGHDGTVPETIRDKVVMTLYNITRENTIGTYTPARPGPDSFAVVKPPIYVNLYLMFMANFSEKNYTDGLEAISRIISFFQQNPSFTQANAPNLPPDVEKITLDMENLSPVDVNYIMGILGTKYLPAAFYKLRLLSFDSTAMQSRTYGVMGHGVSEAPEAPETPDAPELTA